MCNKIVFGSLSKYYDYSLNISWVMIMKRYLFYKIHHEDIVLIAAHYYKFVSNKLLKHGANDAVYCAEIYPIINSYEFK